ncbi:pyrroline-5-carboxylate reductase [Ketogulonicigenium robustum]|uniref:Pyrroline-5-carboxylate reductase n=1 Tax=Ketogulonicigenium robustum TaxID=92947 RepID=A0A1W6NXR9_9RHOB|nr:pyrroline-5-carboxylate reductase [Ketogulonicigenium robustum]ARO13979.1 pyrroline-5-carboxylate reductase [Ketogulonicigenium robustum]
MIDDSVRDKGLVLLGCGKMGSAMLAGWLAGGLPATSVWVNDPHPSDWLLGTGVHVNQPLPAHPAVVLIAVKPQQMADALPTLQALGNGDTLFLSIAAGITIGRYQDILGAQTPIVRAMPNTPAAIGQGITALIGNANVTATQLETAEGLLQAVGQTVRLETEDQIDAVTALSGGGPAYVFHLIETLAAAGEAVGLPPDMAMTLAKVTVAGSGQLAIQSPETPTQLRINVTSPKGTTLAALNVLMDEESGFPALVPKAIKAARDRSAELASGA